MNTQTQTVIRAAQNWNTWGRFAAARYCEKRGVDLRLVRLARQLEAAQGAGIGE